MPSVWKQLLLRDIHKADEIVSLQTKGLQGFHSQAESLCYAHDAGKKKGKEKKIRKASSCSPDFEKNKFKSFSCYTISRKPWANFSPSAIAPPPWSGGWRAKRVDEVRNSKSYTVLQQLQLPALTGP